MSDIAIQIENLGKRYRYGEVKANLSLRDDISQWFKGLVGKNSDGPKFSLRAVQERRIEESSEYFWALKDINLEIKHGEVVGIIGRNGAGKSTLLKILSRITPPTRGKITYHGRIASLLEVGTGFHRDLTGRENVFLNGSILGMKRSEITAKFKEIVEFAEVKDFIDTPVKFYSSGMYVRLAFAVAAHLEPEILVIDEVLAVGDASFQKKCMGKMSEVARHGRTVLFVSHNTAAITTMCQRAFLLKKGTLVDQGPAKDVVQSYLQSVYTAEVTGLRDRKDRGGDGSTRFTALRIESLNEDGLIHPASRLKFTMNYESEGPVRFPQFQIAIHDYTTGTYLLRLDSDAVVPLAESIPAKGVMTCVSEPINLTPGRCLIDLTLRHGKAMADSLQQAGHFDVIADDSLAAGKFPQRTEAVNLIKHQWQATVE